MSENMVQQSTDDLAAQAKARKGRNAWLAFALVGFVIIVGVTTAIRIQETFSDKCNRLYFTGSMSDAAAEAKCRQEGIGPYRNDEAETVNE